MNSNPYFYEIIQDYKMAATKEEQENIFCSFCSSIWSSPNKRRVYKKAITFQVRKDLLQTKLGQVFYTWSLIEYKGYKSFTTECDFISFIRQKINNLYTRYFDKEVILQSDYIYLLKFPKRLYLAWISGQELSVEEAILSINNAITEAQKLKEQYQNYKIELSWNFYKNLIETILRKAFDHCKLIEEYENQSIANCYDFVIEDNFYVSYFNKYLECEMKQWQRRYYGVRGHHELKRCILCGSLIEKKGNHQKYCPSCQKQKRKEINRNYYRKIHPKTL